MKSQTNFFSVDNEDQRYHPKEIVIGIEVDGEFKAYPFSEPEKLKDGQLKGHFQGQDLLIHYHQDSRSTTISNSHKKELPAITTFWFAWYSFHP